MRISIMQSDLLDAVRKVKRALPTTSSLPVLTHIYLGYSNGAWRIAATNLDCMALVTLPDAKVSTEEDGAITMPGKALSDLLPLLSEGRIDITTQDSYPCQDGSKRSVVTLLNGATKTAFYGPLPDDFPSLPALPETEPVMITTL